MQINLFMRQRANRDALQGRLFRNAVNSLLYKVFVTIFSDF